jgi:hypothetical protein
MHAPGLGRAGQRPREAEVDGIDGFGRKADELRRADPTFRGPQPRGRRDDVHADLAAAGINRRWCRKAASVGELAPEVQAADERKHVAKGRTLVGSQTTGQLELRVRREQLARPSAAAMGRGQQEDV